MATEYSFAMSAKFDELERDALALDVRGKAKLARTLIDDLDPGADSGVEALWLEEAQSRLQAYRAGRMEVASGEEAMQRARKRLR
jgi:hypothetical protein